MSTAISQYVADWFMRGDDDIKTMEILLKENGTPNVICFHAQQAAEKYLKGYLAYHERHVRKIHDVTALLDACVEIDSTFESLRDDTRFLGAFYVESRYPDDYVEFSKIDAEQAYKAATRIKNFVLEKINN
jgi:HEPN domain-containing protein